MNSSFVIVLVPSLRFLGNCIPRIRIVFRRNVFESFDSLVSTLSPNTSHINVDLQLHSDIQSHETQRYYHRDAIARLPCQLNKEQQGTIHRNTQLNRLTIYCGHVLYSLMGIITIAKGVEYNILGYCYVGFWARGLWKLITLRLRTITIQCYDPI